MRDFPVFTTENGIGSLILKEIPYTGKAYITILDSQEPTTFLEECKSFCKAVGAERIYAKGHRILEEYPLYTEIWEMKMPVCPQEDTGASLFPVTEKTLEQWMDIYNSGMAEVANAAYMSKLGGRELLKKGNGYFVHRDGKVLGIGIASGNEIEAVVAVVPGTGRDIMLTLFHALSGECVKVQVASVNPKALRLYERMGFIKTGEIAAWYKIL